MKVDILHDDADGSIEVHPEQRLVKLVWKRPVAGEAYRSLLLRLLEVVRATGAKLWMSDGRKAGPILYDDQVWSMKEFTPQVMAAGLERIAIVNSEDGLNLLAVDRMVNATPPGAPYDIGFFEDPSIAQLWLMDPARSRTRVDTPPASERP
ncbi:MAG: hypothetical protein KIT10_09265 [Flavobacteriales bacterium]|nr:hypothetical protein [Flavobacteriales bacterium]